MANDNAGTGGPSLPEGWDWRALTPEDSPQTPMDIMADPNVVALSTPAVQQDGPAYGFTSPVYDFSSGSQVATGMHFDLLEAAREAPVALIFGSYT